MKASELRIGNYVWDDYGGNMIIHQISNDLVDCKKENHLPSGRFDLSSIKPISIDSNWLVKLGFDNLGKYGYAKGDFKLEFTSNIITIQDCLFVLWVNSRIIRIKGVNQLQNLYFALTGEELNLNTNQ